MTVRHATRADLDAIAKLMDAAISELQRSFLDDRQIESSRAIMGVDTRLVDEGTYFIVETDVSVDSRYSGISVSASWFPKMFT